MGAMSEIDDCCSCAESGCGVQYGRQYDIKQDHMAAYVW